MLLQHRKNFSTLYFNTGNRRRRLFTRHYSRAKRRLLRYNDVRDVEGPINPPLSTINLRHKRPPNLARGVILYTNSSKRSSFQATYTSTTTTSNSTKRSGCLATGGVLSSCNLPHHLSDLPRRGPGTDHFL